MLRTANQQAIPTTKTVAATFAANVAKGNLDRGKREGIEVVHALRHACTVADGGRANLRRAKDERRGTGKQRECEQRAAPAEYDRDHDGCHVAPDGFVADESHLTCYPDER